MNPNWVLRMGQQSHWGKMLLTEYIFIPVDNFGTVVGENPTPYGILVLWAVKGLSIVYWDSHCFFSPFVLYRDKGQFTFGFCWRQSLSDTHPFETLRMYCVDRPGVKEISGPVVHIHFIVYRIHACKSWWKLDIHLSEMGEPAFWNLFMARCLCLT